MIDIPFNDWSRERLRDGRKSCTSRKKKYGVPGDLFEVGGTTYQITNIEKQSLAHVAVILHDQEGADNHDEFVQVWESIHPKRGYNPTDIVYVHFFEEVTDDRQRKQ